MSRKNVAKLFGATTDSSLQQNYRDKSITNKMKNSTATLFVYLQRAAMFLVEI